MGEGGGGYEYGREVGGEENEKGCLLEEEGGGWKCWNVGMLECEKGGRVLDVGWDGMRWSMVDGIYGVDCDGLMEFLVVFCTGWKVFNVHGEGNDEVREKDNE